jgi:hypothetical protein
LSGSAKYKLLKVREKKCFVLLQYFNRNSLASHNNQIQLADKIAKRKQLTIQGITTQSICTYIKNFVTKLLSDAARN